MAQKGVQLDTESISCSICLEVPKDPVTIPCGHSYCMSCIKAHLDGEDQKGLHSFPQCRESHHTVSAAAERTVGQRELEGSPSLPALRESTHAALSELTDKLQHLLTLDWTKVSLAAAQPDVLLPPEPESRVDFLRCSRDLTLDPNTVSRRLLLSEGNRKVTCTYEPQPYPYHPDRFTNWSQVLSRESLTGRCYWEVEWRGGVGVAVAYKNISRKGNECGFGFNDKSWALFCDVNSSIFRFNSIETSLPAPLPSRVGVYLDHRAGILSFYSVSETRTLLNRVQTTFTQPLYAGLWIGDSAELCELR